MTRRSDGLGRTIIIAAIAGSLFTGFLARTPRLTASETRVGDVTTATEAPAVQSTLPEISDPVVAAPARPETAQVTVTTEPPATAVTSFASDVATTSTTEAMDPAFDGSIELTVEARTADDARAQGVIVEGDELQWRFVLSNVSDEELWGAYVYLELEGPAWCDEHNLRPGESTECWIATTAVEGIHTAAAWATAWTVDHIVMDSTEYTFEVML